MVNFRQNLIPNIPRFMDKCLEGNEKVLFVIARGFGDAIIADSMIHLIGERFQGLELHVLMKPQFSAIFSGNPHIKKVHFSPFPIGMKRATDFRLKEFACLIRTLKLLRKEKFDLSIETMGDLREALIARFVNPSRSLSVIWHPSHPMYYDVRGKFIARFLATDSVKFTPNIRNIYDAKDYFLQSLGCEIGLFSKERSKPIYYSDEDNSRKISKIIGIHPFAFHKSRMLPFNCWRLLIDKLLCDGFEVWIFCSEIERSVAERYFNKTVGDGTISIKAGDLPSFLTDLRKVGLLIGLDSFSVHAAHATAKPSIAICRGERYKFWLPSSCRPVVVDNNSEMNKKGDDIFVERVVSKVYKEVRDMLGILQCSSGAK